MLLLVHTTTQTFRSLALPSELHAVPHGSNSMLSELCIIQTWDVVWQYLQKREGHSSQMRHSHSMQHTIRGSNATENRIVISPCRKLPSLAPLLPRACDREGKEVLIAMVTQFGSSVMIFTLSVCFLSPCSIDTHPRVKTTKENCNHVLHEIRAGSMVGCAHAL